jgi:hypothetical protein
MDPVKVCAFRRPADSAAAMHRMRRELRLSFDIETPQANVGEYIPVRGPVSNQW